MQPVSKEVQKTVCCLCCASGPIVITARIPRSGFCIGKDKIPLEVSVENGSNKTIRQIQAFIQKNVVYTAQSIHSYESKALKAVSSGPISAHNSTVFRPEPIEIPLESVVPTLANCAIIVVQYCLRVSVALSCAINPHIDFSYCYGKCSFAK